MADKISSTSNLEVSLPKAGEVVEYQISSDVPVKFTFFVSEVVFSCNGNDLVFTGEGGGSVVIKDYLALAQENALPSFELKGGEEVPGDIYLFAFNDADQSIETAAGGNMDNSATGDDYGDTISPSEWLEPLMVPEAGDSSSSLDILTPDDLFLGDSQGDVGSEFVAVSLLGATSISVAHEMPMGSFADGYDSVSDTIQLIIDSPEYA
ncbi:hypothetical protein SYK_10330 [Pseudodesulfovibrio nedwellii]|uniref:Uncharacterized protein n=1 Tax=Pseudodesulfovibrio nedwellii TaxID=2973072 RepID=A0ABM8AYS3_9BACT|nr:hypothetical protein [Pseudodesulfovibrio nedwellii]BDQ36673.1 hypothetical protein SYK_10330 [Pseudodesulfovibrio nedwellii]